MLKLLIDSEHTIINLLKKGAQNIVSIMSLFHRSKGSLKKENAYWSDESQERYIELEEHHTEADIVYLSLKNRINQQQLAALRAKKEIEEIWAEEHARHSRHTINHSHHISNHHTHGNALHAAVHEHHIH